MTLSDCAIVIYFAHLSIKKSSNNVSPSDKLYWKQQDFSERPSFLCVCRFFCAPCTRPVRKVSSRCWWSLRSQPYFVNLLSPHTLSTPEVRSFRKCIKRLKMFLPSTLSLELFTLSLELYILGQQECVSWCQKKKN